jgi:hypothetical protein
MGDARDGGPIVLSPVTGSITTLATEVQLGALLSVWA